MTDYPIVTDKLQKFAERFFGRLSFLSEQFVGNSGELDDLALYYFGKIILSKPIAIPAEMW